MQPLPHAIPNRCNHPIPNRGSPQYPYQPSKLCSVFTPNGTNVGGHPSILIHALQHAFHSINSCIMPALVVVISSWCCWTTHSKFLNEYSTLSALVDYYELLHKYEDFYFTFFKIKYFKINAIPQALLMFDPTTQSPIRPSGKPERRRSQE